MRNVLALSALLSISALAVWAQSSTQAVPAKPAPAKAPVHHAAAGPPTAIIETTAGKLTCTLFPDKAPIGVANFIGLATGTKDWKNPVSGVTKHGVPLYDGTIFHRVIAGFMIQGGDPKGDGTGDPGYAFKNEVSSDLLFDKPGRLAYANSGPNTNGSQFFIMEDALTGHHAALRWALHDLRPVRRGQRGSGETDRAHGYRPDERPSFPSGEDYSHFDCPQSARRETRSSGKSPQHLRRNQQQVRIDTCGGSRLGFPP